MKWNNLLKIRNTKFPIKGQRYLVVIRNDFITEAIFEDYKDMKNPYTFNWIFRDKNYQGEFVQMWCDFPNVSKFYDDDDFPTPIQIKHTLSMAND